MRVSINKLTGKMIESQGGGEVDRQPQGAKETDDDYQIYLDECTALEALRLDTLLQNAINAGHLEKNVEVNYITEEAYQAILEAEKPIPTEAELLELAITAKMVEISDRELRIKAVAEIEAENVAEK